MSEYDYATRAAASLFAEVRGLSQQKARRDKAAFEGLRADWAKWRERRIRSERGGAPRHNLIRLLGVEHSEVGLHSPFLSDLLDPGGTHGQGGLFLRSFLQLLDRKLIDKRHPLAGKSFHCKVSDVPESGEWNVICEGEKIDIRIYSPKAQLMVFIENKIRAGEQENQLRRYRELLTRQMGAYPNGLLIGLSPRGYIFSTGDLDLHLIYEQDIVTWLTEVGRKISDSATKLRGNIYQYCEIVQAFSTE